MSWESVLDEIIRLEELRTREAAGSLSPVQVRRKIQEACKDAVGVIRYDEDLEAAKAELKRILDEDFPKMAVRSSEREYNLDWKEAIENLNILQSAQLMVEATLLREESRMQYIRPSFPDIDDDNWKKMLLLLSLDDSGEFVSEKHQMASID
ncbi:MAG: hypothetical protein ACOYD7_08865 [Raoultibacter sp.]